MAALVEPSDSAHHAADAAREDAGVSSATQDLSRRFEEMDFDHDGAATAPAACKAVYPLQLGVCSEKLERHGQVVMLFCLVHGYLSHTSVPLRGRAGGSTPLVI